MGDIGESGNAVLQTIQASEGGRALRLLRQRQRMRQRMEEEKQKIESKGLKRRNLTFGGSSADRLEDEFKKETIGLLTAQAFKEKRARLEEQIRVEQRSLFPQKLQEKRRMELSLTTSKLSFGDSEEADEVLVQAVDKAFRATAAEAAAAAAAAVPAPAPVSAASHHASLQQQQQSAAEQLQQQAKKKQERPLGGEREGQNVEERVKAEVRTSSSCSADIIKAAAATGGDPVAVTDSTKKEVVSSERSDSQKDAGRGAAQAEGEAGSICSGAAATASSASEHTEKEQKEGSDRNKEMAETLSVVWRRRRRIGKDPTVDTNFLPDEDRDAQVLSERQRLIEEYQRIEAEARKEPLWVTYSFWDGTGHRRRTCVKKGSTVLQFLDQARSELEKEFAELRGLSAADLLYVKEDLILPHNTTFYDLIKTKARGKSGPLFTFNVHEDVRMVNDSRLEKADSHAGKVVERKWFERNKHIFPASRWEVYSPQKAYDTYTIHGGVHKWKGMSNSEIREAIV